jgi:hypothetical protein
VRAPSQGYYEDINGNYGGGDPRYGEGGRRDTPFSLGDNKEGDHRLVGNRDLPRLREVTPTEK